jgi:16S rRNA (cytidine1402-2'-O)-methyltransferase
MAKLILVPTPIGNLQDITIRAVNVLKQCDYILAEDTRNTLFLLRHLGIDKKVHAYHAHNEHKQMDQIIAHLKLANSVALVSDAGTPGISDPGFLLVRTCIQNQIEIETLPGATAFVPALVNSGLPNNRFCFEGFFATEKRAANAFKSACDRNTYHRNLRIAIQTYKMFYNNLPKFWVMKDGVVYRERAYQNV